jgi:hypothetical protein
VSTLSGVVIQFSLSSNIIDARVDSFQNDILNNNILLLPERSLVVNWLENLLAERCFRHLTGMSWVLAQVSTGFGILDSTSQCGAGSEGETHFDMLNLVQKCKAWEGSLNSWFWHTDSDLNNTYLKKSLEWMNAATQVEYSSLHKLILTFHPNIFFGKNVLRVPGTPSVLIWTVRIHGRGQVGVKTSTT